MPKPKHLLVVATAILLLMVLFPPYFGVYDQSGVNRHTSLGWHPIWNPPSQAEAYRVIHDEPHDAVPDVPESDRRRAAEERLALTRVGFNKVGFVFQLIVLCAVTAVGVVIVRRWRRMTRMMAT
ncbi:MAG: hypothetical protein JSW51_04270 [Gemmatimonadota bacterium]|nr:MAG: hypothetical protein JSW51_04270 [Gemmatimonadota bacterium]